MALSESEAKHCEKVVGHFIERARPPASLRAEVDLSFRMVGQSVELFEVRRHWRKPGGSMEVPVAKATFDRGGGNWQVFWRPCDLRWHSYEPTPRVPTIAAFLALVEQEAHACFYG